MAVYLTPMVWMLFSGSSLLLFGASVECELSGALDWLCVSVRTDKYSR